MKSIRLWVLLLAGIPATAAVPRVAVPSLGLSAGAFSGAPVLAAAPNLLAAAPLTSAPPLLSASPFSAAAPLSAPEAALQPALAATENGMIRARDVGEGLTALRAASYDIHPQVEELVGKINAAHPQLPISTQHLFLVRDLEVLRQLGIPEDAGGAARILFDGRSEQPVVILAAARPVALDNFVEFGVHEAVHLMDDGILRVPHDEEIKHFFAEGWTQSRAVTLANVVLRGMGRPETPGKAYHKEIELVNAFIALHGSAALDELVRTGSDAAMRAALGSRWDLALRVVSGDGGKTASREKRLNALIALVNAKAVGPDEERALLDYIRR